MQRDPSYPGLDDSWFDRGQPRAPLTRAAVMAELKRQRPTSEQLDDLAIEPDLADSWFDR